ncbi:MAG TPA: hypothetical protein VG326_02940 [Tepidisphaeraceae bacterium]|nr:hypothetical protein [Tepidisphaeraceae bacterium]
MRGLFGALAVFAPAGVGLGAWAAVRDRRFGPLIYAVPAMLATSGYTWLFLQWLK